ncbi:AraC family transcriptional regulator ligand-binding domain-containing protein [Nocardioides sp. SOB77]|uniref:AraC family transcriptional regulator ligand-binding domain-containing protein n=1 Tax=Nocardioides oceani TaxID=3058369 RepID=A0ABT8FAZ0_9ACTN|nr:AraC family transcriptional regulator [Nocardioides oceani]MDN4171858.1 AraC family transcriptional regulator ligand-binding domain-containing protein [Nocardioides oceani]
MGHIRSAGLRGLRATVAELGGDAERLARAAQLPVEALDRDDVLVDEQAAATVLELAARELGAPDLGLRIAARQDLAMLGSLAVAIQHSPTLGDALACTSRYLFVHGRSLSLTVGPDPSGDRSAAALLYGPATSAGPVQGTDLGVGFVHRTITYLVGGPYGLRSVDLPYRPPAPAAAYEEFFGAPVRPGRDVPAAVLRVPRELSQHELTGVNDNLRLLALAFLAEQSPDVERRLAPRVRAVVQEALGTRPVDVGTVAALLSMHPRTLQRRLEGEGTTFGALLDDVRRQVAQRLLTTTDLPLGQVAGMVGFAEQSALSRSARRWWGRAPRTVRRDGPG